MEMWFQGRDFPDEMFLLCLKWSLSSFILFMSRATIQTKIHINDLFTHCQT